MPPYMMYHSHGLGGLIFVICIWVVQLAVAVLIYRDAKEQKMLGPVWVILGILPFFGYLVDVLYLIIRELRPVRKTETPPASL